MMAKRDSTSQRTLSKAQRRMKIGYVSIRHFNPRTCMTTYYSLSPSLLLNGNWLAEAGFTSDTPVMVSVEQGRLVIEPFKG